MKNQALGKVLSSLVKRGSIFRANKVHEILGDHGSHRFMNFTLLAASEIS